MKKTNLLTIAAAAVLFLTACAQTAPAEELILNDGNFYFMGDTDACYISVNNGNIRFVGTDENMRTYYSAYEEDYNKKAGGSPGRPFEDYQDYETFCEEVKYELGEEEWVPYEISVLPDPISKTVVFFDPYYYEQDGETIGPGGISMDYIDENNIGDMGSKRGGIDLIFTRVADSE